MNKRLRGFLAAFLGLAALVALGLALMALFGGQDGLPVAQEPPTPLGTQWTYPVGHTPPPTITPVPPAGSYPLPTQGPTLTPEPTETPWPTPEPPPPPQPVGLQMVWAEAVADRKAHSLGPLSFYMADVGDVTRRKQLHALQDDQCSGVSLSPDRKMIAFITYQGAHLAGGGMLWIMRLDEDQPWELTQGINARGAVWWASYPAWSRDSRLLAYVRYTPRVSPLVNKESSPDRPEIHTISVDGKEDKTLFAEDDVVLYLLGWAADGRLLCLLSSARPDIKPGLWSLDAVSGERTFITALPRGEAPQLAPDGRRLLFWTTEGFVCLSADGRERKIVEFPGIVITSTDPMGTMIHKQVADVSWAASSSEVIFQTGPDSWRIGNLDTGAVRDIIVAPEPPEFRYDLISVSPDGQWLLVENYPRGGASLLKADTRIRLLLVDGSFLFGGWLPDRFDGGL